MDDKATTSHSPPQPAKRRFFACISIALAAGILAAFAWSQALPSGLDALLFGILLTVFAGVSLVVALVTLWIWIQKRDMPPASRSSLPVVIALIAASIVLTITGAMAARVIGTLWGRTHPSNSTGVADRRVLDRSIAEQSMPLVEQFLKDLPRHSPDESAWVSFRRQFGGFISWAKTDSSGAYHPVIHRQDVFDLYQISFSREAVFENGTVNIVIIVQRGRTLTNKPDVVALPLGTNPRGTLRIMVSLP